LPFSASSAITRRSRRPADQGLPWRRTCPKHTLLNDERFCAVDACPSAVEESQMPKMKTKSGAKKRFKVTAGGKVLYQQSRKRHGMIKRTKKQIRQLRGTNVVFKTDGDRIKKYFLPNG
jgi:large subunit ribosomal protein L35